MWRCLLGACFTLPFLLIAQRAGAQTVNYGALEQLFGEPVTTSATGQPQRANEAPAAMEIVSATQIRRAGAVDLPGVLKQVPGVDVLRWDTDDSDVSVRGYDQSYSPRLLVLVDGRQVYADQYGFTPWAAVPVEMADIRQIEVVKGPNTALLGANAASGAINIITYNPLYDDVNNLSVTGGTQSTIRGSAVVTLQDKGVWGVRVSTGASLDHGFPIAFPAYIPLQDQKANTGAALNIDGTVQLNRSLQLGLELTHSEVNRNEMDPSYYLTVAHYKTSSIKGQLNADTGIGLLQFMAYTNWMGSNYKDDVVGPMDFDNQSTVIQLQDVLSIGTSHVVRAAFEFRHNEANTTPVKGGRIFYDTPSVSGMWNWAVTPRLSLTNAVRLDSLALGRSGTSPAGYPFSNSAWNHDMSQWSFNSGLVWKVSDSDTLRLLASRGIQLPSLAHLGAFLVSGTYPVNLSGSPKLTPSAVMNYELDWNRTVDAIGGVLRGAFFVQKTTNIIGVAGDAVFTPAFYGLTANIGDSDSAGAELVLNGEFSEHWHWGASYRIESVKDKFLPLAQHGGAFTDFEHTTPRHQIKANLGWSLAPWEADAAFYYQSGTEGLIGAPPSSALIPIPAYANADARIGYRINDNLTLSVAGENLLSSRQVQTSGPVIERRVFIGLSAGF